jgi:hypothetical protein
VGVLRLFRLVAVLVVGAIAGCGHPQLPKPLIVEKPVEPPPPAREGVIPRGALVVARLDKPLGSDLSTRGQEYSATTVTPILDRRGRTLVPSGVRLEGHVQSVGEGHGVTPGHIVLSVDRLLTGELERTVRARISSMDTQQLAAPPSSAPVRAGAIGGGLIGGALMRLPGWWLGAGIGASGGITSSLESRPIDIRLPAGAYLTIRFDAPVAIT